MDRQHRAIRTFVPWALALSLFVTIPKTSCAAAADSAEAQVEVRVPTDATVWFDGELTTLTGPVRCFWTPPLPLGKVYTYQVKARWMLDGAPFEQVKPVKVWPAETSYVRFHTDKRRLRVRLLVDANALVWFNGGPTKQKGAERYYYTDPLPPDESVYYDVRASWSEQGHLVEQTRTAQGKPGSLVTVDFTGQRQDGVSPAAATHAGIRNYFSLR